MQQEETVSAQSAAISQLQNEMKELKDMLAQLVTVQMGNAAPAHAGNQQQHQIIDLDINEVNNESIPVQATSNVRQASVKEIANTLPEFDPNDDNAISVNQFIDRVNKVVDAYSWDEKFLLLAIYTKLKGPAKMWLDSSAILHITWKNFAEAIKDEFGANPDEAEVHFNMANATRRPKETVKEYCFRMSALGVRYKLSEAAIIRYVRAGVQHRELQNSDAAESYFVNRGRSSTSKKEYSPKASNFEQKPDSDVKPPRSKESVICYNCGERGHFANSCPKEKKKSRCTKCNKFHEPNGSCHATNVMRLLAANQDKLFTRKICVHSHDYSAFIDTGSQASLIRQSVAEQINAKRHKCSMKIRGICGGSCILTEAMTVDMEIDGKTITAKVYIADNDLLQKDFLLGQDVIISAHLQLNFESGDSKINRAVHQATTPVSTNIAKLLENFQNDKECKQMRGLMENFADVFSTGLEGIGKTSVVKAYITVESSQVVAQAPYRVSEPKKEIVSRMVDELLKQDIITLSTSQYASPVVLIKKPNGSDRM
ncbi:uncharacterized protein [Drosophila suzukii]|uniref:CCHC-type domain-containing protein n=1 Tax=Drosophila suzukii TaxID=28584 RepID=A0ABM4TUQ8_DROSZ